MSRELPNVASILGEIFAKVAAEERPLLLAFAERLAGQRYRDWAASHHDPTVARGLLACADREEEIARRVEALEPQAQAIQERILTQMPELPELSETIFAGRPLSDQLTIQASGERAGASTWKVFADSTADENVRDVYLSCAPLELENAAFLESLLDAVAG
jgi:rubrerythrin